MDTTRESIIQYRLYTSQFSRFINTEHSKADRDRRARRKELI